MSLPELQHAKLAGKRVLIRFDGDVPVEHGIIQDDYRLQAALPTIQHCLTHGASVVLLAHRGRPVLPHPDSALSNRVLVPYFEKVLGESVAFYPLDAPVDTHHRIVLLENLRFDAREEKNDPRFADSLARWGDIYCNDAFAVSHRAHASIVALAHCLPHYAGIHLAEEVKALTNLLKNPDAPYTVVLGGAKASDKSPIIADLIGRVDTLVIGGLIAVTYLAAMGYRVGAHELDATQVTLAQRCIRRFHEEGITCVLPVDIITQHQEIKPLTAWGKDDLMLDIGPASQVLFTETITKANTLFWNGAMGKFEDAAFAKGTVSVGRAVAHSSADTRIASGGDTVSAIHHYKMEKNFTYISTGGGATLEFIAGRDLPGIKALYH